MKLHLFYTHLLVAALLGGAALVATAQTTDTNANLPGSIKVGPISGKATLVNPNTGETSDAAANQVFGAPTTIVTDSESKVLLLFSNGCSVEVQPGSNIQITDFTQQPYDASLGTYQDLGAEPSSSQVRINVVNGEVAARVIPLDPASVFLIVTPTGTIRANEEVVVVSYDAQTADTIVANIGGGGSVTFTDNSGNASPVAPGQSLSVPGVIDAATGAVSSGQPTTAPNSPQVAAAGNSVQQATQNAGSGSFFSPAIPTTPPAGLGVTPAIDIPELIDPTSTAPVS